MKHVPHTGAGLRAGTMLDGVCLRKLTRNRDERGSFTELFCQSWDSDLQLLQWSAVTSEPRVLRGVYLHRRHDEYLCVLQGRASVGLRDLRPWSPTAGAWALIELRGDDLAALWFPRGIAHGWYCHQPTLHLQAVSECYDDYHADDNLGCHWADPDLEIPWPDRSPIVSARSEELGSLQQLLSALAG